MPEWVAAELTAKGFFASENSPKYKNLNSQILVVCEKGHEFYTTLKSVRYSGFMCPVCVGEETKGFKNHKKLAIGKKQGYRIIGLDNATYRMGISLFEDGKLIYYDLLTFRDSDHIRRLNQIRDLFEDEILKEWQPDFIQMEEIQLQRSHATYEILIKLIGTIEMACDRLGVKCDKTRASTWRSALGINSRDRATDKKKAIELVKLMYDIDVNDDVAEAILIGRYRSMVDEKNKVKDLF